MTSELDALSAGLAAAVERAGQAVVAVHARPRFSSSGVIWRPGIIVTAEHTVRREEEITITLPDGSDRPATLAGRDPGTDLAVLKLEEPAAGTAATPSESALRPGHLILTVGRSQDSGVNASFGIVSALSGSWRTWRGGRLDQYLRLDLTMFPNSSGGAAVDSAGGVVGIATSALSRVAGVAIPASTVNRVLDEILVRGHVARGYLGLGLRPVAVSDHHKGLIVLSVESGGPASKAGVLVGDILMSLDSKPTTDTDEVQSALEGSAVGRSMQAGLLRGGESKTVSVIIGERPRRD